MNSGYKCGHRFSEQAGTRDDKSVEVVEPSALFHQYVRRTKSGPWRRTTYQKLCRLTVNARIAFSSHAVETVEVQSAIFCRFLRKKKQSHIALPQPPTSQKPLFCAFPSSPSICSLANVVEHDKLWRNAINSLQHLPSNQRPSRPIESAHEKVELLTSPLEFRSNSKLRAVIAVALPNQFMTVLPVGASQCYDYVTERL